MKRSCFRRQYGLPHPWPHQTAHFDGHTRTPIHFQEAPSKRRWRVTWAHESGSMYCQGASARAHFLMQRRYETLRHAGSAGASRSCGCGRPGLPLELGGWPLFAAPLPIDQLAGSRRALADPAPSIPLGPQSPSFDLVRQFVRTLACVSFITTC